MLASVKENLKWYLLAVLFLANLLVWHAVFTESRDGTLTVAFLDVGQGGAVFIEAPNGNQMLIDGGRSQRVLRVLSDMMPFYDRSIDIVVATHPDADHIGGLPAVFERYRVAHFIDPDVGSDTGVYQALVRSLEKEGARVHRARRGMEVLLGPNTSLFVLFPDRDVSSVDANDASIIARLVHGEISFLLTGDAPKRIEEYVAFLEGDMLNADVLKVGHHGSKTSTSDALIGFASPAWAVISSGEDNYYGHPHAEVLDRLHRFGVKILRTDENGTVVFESDGMLVSPKGR